MEQALFDRNKLEADYQMALRLSDSFLGNIQRVVAISASLDVRPIIQRVFPKVEVVEAEQTKPVRPETTGFPDHHTIGFTANPVFHDVFIQKEICVFNGTK